MKSLKLLGVAIAGLALVAAMPASAITKKKELSNRETFTPEDATKAQAYVDAAMTVPMLTLLKKADVQHPDMMLEYGIGLDLGRPSMSSSLSQGEKDKLKRGFRAMLDLYINSADHFDITFNEDAMLDQSEFWIYLAKHVGRQKPRESLNGVAAAMNTMPGGGGGGPMAFIPDSPDQDKEFNLNEDLILKPNVLNAATACGQSAFGFARMKKAQTVDIAETKLTPEQFATVQTNAVKAYRMAWSEGPLACGSKEYFFKVVDFASHNLGKLGEMKDAPGAVPAELTDTPVQP